MNALPPWERFRYDMNYDGLVTISDVWLWIKWLYFFPGDTGIWAMNGAPLATFLELSSADYGGWFSGILSLILWLLAFNTIIIGSIELSASIERLVSWFKAK